MQIERVALKCILNEVKPAVASSGSVPELKHVWWDGQFLFGYNGALGIRVPWQWDLHPGGVLASVLLGVLDSYSADKVDLSAAGGTLTVKAGKSTVKLAFLEASANPWPFKDSVKGAQFSVKLTDELTTGLKRARVIKASNPVRTEHYGVVMFPDKDFLSLFSTDSKTMVEVRVSGKFDRELNKLVLPHAFVQQLLELTENSTTLHFLSDAIVAVEEGGVQVCSNMLDSGDVWDLPKLADDLMKDATDGYIKIPEGWTESLSRAVAMAGSDESFLKLVVSPKNKELTLTGRVTYGSVEERLPVAGKFPAGQITLELAALKVLTRDAVSFAVAERALVINGKNEELLLIAAHEEAEESRSRRARA